MESGYSYKAAVASVSYLRIKERELGGRNSFGAESRLAQAFIDTGSTPVCGRTCYEAAHSGAMLRPFMCLVRGGHRWETVTDTSGSVTTCARCGRMCHDRTYFADTEHRRHTNLAYDTRPWKIPGPSPPRNRDRGNP